MCCVVLCCVCVRGYEFLRRPVRAQHGDGRMVCVFARAHASQKCNKKAFWAPERKKTSDDHPNGKTRVHDANWESVAGGKNSGKKERRVGGGVSRARRKCRRAARPLSEMHSECCVGSLMSSSSSSSWCDRRQQQKGAAKRGQSNYPLLRLLAAAAAARRHFKSAPLSERPAADELGEKEKMIQRRIGSSLASFNAACFH